DASVVGRPAEHGGAPDSAVAGLAPPYGLNEFRAPCLHIVLGSDGQRLELLLRPDDMLEGSSEFCSQPSMGDNDDADHRVMYILCRGAGRRCGTASRAEAAPRGGA